MTILAIIDAPTRWAPRFAAIGGDIRFDTRFIDISLAEALVQRWSHQAIVEMHAGSIESRRKGRLLAKDACDLERAMKEALRWREAAGRNGRREA